MFDASHSAGTARTEVGAQPLRWLDATGPSRTYSLADRLEQKANEPKASLARMPGKIAGR